MFVYCTRWSESAAMFKVFLVKAAKWHLWRLQNETWSMKAWLAWAMMSSWEIQMCLVWSARCGLWRRSCELWHAWTTRLQTPCMMRIAGLRLVQHSQQWPGVKFLCGMFCNDYQSNVCGGEHREWKNRDIRWTWKKAVVWLIESAYTTHWIMIK